MDISNGAWLLALTIWRDDWLRFNLALVLANLLLGIGNALFNKRIQFYLGATADWLETRIIPFFLGWGAAKLILLAAFGEYVGLANALVGVISAMVTAALLGKLADNLRSMGVPIPTSVGPVALGSPPRPEAKATP